MFTPATASAAARKRKNIGRPGPRSQILRMQAQLLIRATDPKIPAHLQAACARAWDVLEERLRIMDNKPLPGQLRPDLAASAPKRIGPPARTAQRISVLPKPTGPAEPKADVSTQNQSMLNPADPTSTTGA